MSVSYSNQANTIAIESNLNIKLVAVHPSGIHAFLVNEGYFCTQLFSLYSASS